MVQLGMRWQVAAGFTPAPHDEELPVSPISSAAGPELGLKEMDELTPRMPGLADHCESNDGCGPLLLRARSAQRDRCIGGGEAQHNRRENPRK